MKQISSKDRFGLTTGNFQAFKQVSEFLISRKKKINAKILSGSMPQVLVSSLFSSHNNSLFIIAQDNTTAENWYHDLSILVPQVKLALMTEPKKHVRFRAEDLEDHLIWLIDGLSKIQKFDQFIAIATPEIFQIPVPKADTIKQNRINIKIGESIPFDEFTINLALNGFDKKDFVSAHGDMAIRGGIIDIFPIGWDNPLRIEFWGDEIESIREFNPLSQRSIRDLREVEFIANIFHSSSEEKESTILDFISEDTLFIMDSPEQIISKNEDFEYDPHSWLDPISFKAQTQLVLNALIEVFPNGSDTFTANAEVFMAELDKVHLGYVGAFGPEGTCTNKTAAANHNAYSYITERYGVEFVTVHGLDPEGQPSVEDIEKVISKINEDEISVLYIEEYTQASSVDLIVEATNVEVMYLYTMEKAPSDANDDYLSMLNKNLDNLKAGLGCAA